MKTLIISPTYNESKNIESLVEQVLGPNPNFHLLVVDDNSPDGTATIVKELQQIYTNLFIEERPGKAGLGTAYLFGFKWALKNGRNWTKKMIQNASGNGTQIHTRSQYYFCWNQS